MSHEPPISQWIVTKAQPGANNIVINGKGRRMTDLEAAHFGNMHTKLIAAVDKLDGLLRNLLLWRWSTGPSVSGTRHRRPNHYWPPS